MNPTTEQHDAIHSPSTNLLLTACPGSGKSTTLISRIVVDPTPHGKIIVSTFTQRAARELRTKLASLGIFPHYVGTDHGLCLRILQRQDPRTTVMDEETADEMLQQVITSLRAKTTVKAVRTAIATNEKIPAKLSPVVIEYNRLMRDNACYDYDALLRQGALAASTYGDGWSLYVDEYQDTTIDQDLLYDGLRCARRFFVGDADQCIYGFRGSRLENILERAQEEGVQVLKLSGNFRSGSAVVQAANELIRHNAKRVFQGPPMVPMTTRDCSVSTRGFSSEEEELADIVAWAKEKVATRSTAILVRYNAERRAIEDALRTARLPMPTPGAPQPKDMRRLRAFLACMAQPSNQIAVATLLRATHGQDAAQKMIETGYQPNIPARPGTWNGWANTLAAVGFSRGAVVALWDAHQMTSSVEAFDLMLALNGKEPEQPFARQVAVLTFHGAKGLEFDDVWIAAADRDEATNEKDVEDERRLFYVAVTRARNNLTISHSLYRTNAWTHQSERRKPVRYVSEAAILATCGA
jgi:DNA helicase II / ATP-dependent DNA helicase PcrA